MGNQPDDTITKGAALPTVEREVFDLLESAPYYHNLKGLDGRFLYVNPTCEKWLGIPRTDIIGKTAQELFPNLMDLELVEENEKEVLESGKTVVSEAEIRQHDHQVQNSILVKYPVFSDRDKIVAIGTLALDISVLKKEKFALVQSEELFRHAFDNAPVGMALIDLEGRRIRVNQALADFLGYTIDEILNTPMATTNGDLGQLDKSIELRQKVIDGEIQSYTNKRTYRHKEGHIIHGEVTASLVRDQDLNPVYFVAHTVDTTEDEIAKLELIEAKEAAEKASQAKSEFQATMSHELRTPLTSLHGALGLLKGTVANDIPEHGNALLDIALRNSQRLINLVNDFLDYEKIVAGKMVFDMSACDLNSLVLKSVEINQNFATEYGTRFVYKQLEQPVALVVEERRFEQVMSNLLSNAAKFSVDQTDILVLAFEEGDQAKVRIVDKGIGIPKEELGRIFERFSQVDSTDTRENGGTGLGLAITKALVEGMGGSIEVKSALDEGSIFTISFPKLLSD